MTLSFAYCFRLLLLSVLYFGLAAFDQAMFVHYLSSDVHSVM